jgi:branched-chain amino acid transport system substrate-binding protein
MEQGIDYIGMMGTVQHTAAAPITEPAKVLCFNGSNVLNPENLYTFRTNASPTALAVQFTLDFAKEAFPWATKVAILNNDSESGRAMTLSETETAEGLGFEVVFDELHELTTTDFYPYITKVVAADPDIIDTGGSSPSGGIATWVRILQELGWDGKISASLAGPSFAPGAEGLAISEGVFGYMPQDPDSEFMTAKEEELWQRFADMYPDTNLMDYTFSFYEALDGLAQAIEKAGTLDTTAVRDTWADMEWDSVRGTFKFGGEETFGAKRQIQGPICFGEVTGGEVVEGGRIWPDWP